MVAKAKKHKRRPTPYRQRSADPDSAPAAGNEGPRHLDGRAAGPATDPSRGDPAPDRARDGQVPVHAGGREGVTLMPTTIPERSRPPSTISRLVRGIAMNISLRLERRWLRLRLWWIR
jgi:hypothetical protein